MKEAYLYRLTPFSMNVNLKISKRLYRDRLNIAIFVNRLFTYSPSYRNETNALVRRYSSPYFGMEPTSNCNAMMMKSTIRTLFLLSALLFSACEKDDSIFTELSIRFVMPDSRPVEKLEIRTDISYFDNINSGERVPFPAAEQNSATIRLRKGVYTFIVEADATYSTREKKILRCTDYNQIPAAMTWVEDSESIVLLLKSI